MKDPNPTRRLPPAFAVILLLLLRLASAVDFIFNGFDSSNVSLYGNASIDSSRVLTLTNRTNFAVGRALYPTRIPTKDPSSAAVLPFYTSFIFAMAPYRGVLPGHGIVFLFVPHTGINGTSASQNLGLFNFTNNGDPNNHVFGVEFDVFKNEEFKDIDANHVGIDVNSLTSVASSGAGYWPDDANTPFVGLPLNNGKNYQVWIDFSDNTVNVTMAPVGIKRPHRPLLSVSVTNLSGVFQDEMYVGFTSSTGALVQSHKILAWSFSNTNSRLSENLITTGLPSFVLPNTPIHKTRGFIAGTTSGALVLLLFFCAISFFMIRRYQRLKRERDEMEDWELEYWPHRITYHEIESGTKNFSESNVIGVGGNGKVYRGVLRDGSEVAVKRISHESSEGIRAFVAEISSLGRLKQRNLVGLRGWCKKEKGSLILVYDYMENGSLDKRVFECSDDDSRILSLQDRIRILKQVASGVLYLHYGWESKVLHRDIKASNVLLDKEMNARLGDFGLARMHDHDKNAGTTRVVGTIGYLAPEVVRNGKASTRTDVFGYGVLTLEVICGRRPIEDGKPPLVDWAWELLKRGELLTAIDPRLKSGGEFDEEEVSRVLHLGLLCAHPDPNARPTMRQVVKLFEGKTEADEDESEDTEIYLLERMGSREIWNMYPPHVSTSGSNSSHPTFEEIKQELYNSMSLSWSNTVVEGR